MPRLEKEEKAGNEFRYVETEIGKKSKSRGGTGRRQETAPTSSEREERRVGLFDRQSRHWNTKVLAMVAIIVVVAAVIRVGHYSRRHRERSSDPREGHNQAKAVLRARPPSPLSRGCQLQHPPSRCNVFCRRVDDPKAHRSATRNTTGDDSFAECVDRRAIIPTIYLRPGGRQKTRSRASATLDPRSFFTKREMKTRDRANSKRLTRIVLTWFYFPFEEDRERIVKKDR